MSCETGTDVFACWPAKKGSCGSGVGGSGAGCLSYCRFCPPGPCVDSGGLWGRIEERRSAYLIFFSISASCSLSFCPRAAVFVLSSRSRWNQFDEKVMGAVSSLCFQ